MISLQASRLVAVLALCIGTADAEPGSTTVPVAGSGVDHLVTALVHAQEPTPTGKIQKSTEIVELSGDLKGFVLYHVTSVFDFAAGTLVNTGDQVYSGTIAGSAPVSPPARRAAGSTCSTTSRVRRSGASWRWWEPV